MSAWELGTSGAAVAGFGIYTMVRFDARPVESLGFALEGIGLGMILAAASMWWDARRPADEVPPGVFEAFKRRAIRDFLVVYILPGSIAMLFSDWGSTYALIVYVGYIVGYNRGRRHGLDDGVDMAQDAFNAALDSARQVYGMEPEGEHLERVRRAPFN